MSGIEFRVGRSDHHKVEDFLTTGPGGVHGVRLDATNLKLHTEVADAARRAGVAVLVEPLTERMTQPGFSPPVSTTAQDRRSTGAASAPRATSCAWSRR